VTSGSRAAAATVAVLLGAVTLSACGGSSPSAAVRRPAAPSTSVPPPTTLPAPTTGTTRAPVVGRTYAVGITDTTYVDPSRPTAANGSFPGAADRTLPVTIWYPATGDPGGDPVRDAAADPSGGPYPLVVFAHGYAVTPSFYAELLQRWAAAGYVVAAPTYPIWSGVPGGLGDTGYEQSFADTSFVITQLLRASSGASGSSPLAGSIDPARIGAAGHSNGEAVAYGVGFLTCCRDARVRSVIALAGNLSNINNPVQRDNGVPLLHVMGEADELQPYADAIAWDRANLGSPHWSVTLVGGSHAPPYRSPGDSHFAGVVAITTAFLDGTLKGSADRLAAIDTEVAADPAHFRLER
jgi:dienelactone hydrolase